MILLCHDTGCTGNSAPAGSNPESRCTYCAEPLMDGHGCILLAPGQLPSVAAGTELTVDLTDVDPAASQVCQIMGAHAYEGRYFASRDRLAGACVRCGVRILTDGR